MEGAHTRGLKPGLTSGSASPVPLWMSSHLPIKPEALPSLPLSAPASFITEQLGGSGLSSNVTLCPQQKPRQGTGRVSIMHES